MKVIAKCIVFINILRIDVLSPDSDIMYFAKSRLFLKVELFT